MTTSTTHQAPSEQQNDQTPPLIPVRMLNEHVYCPRLAYLEWADGEFADNAYTLEGRARHTRVDQREQPLPEVTEEDQERPVIARSVTLSSERLGIIAKTDLVETTGPRATPVDYKRGKRPHIAAGAYEPERVQLCAQGLLLREHGFTCEAGVLYFAASRERVRVYFDAELIALTLRAIEELRQAVAAPVAPPPLVDSPKCPRCSLLPICLPDEVGWLQGQQAAPRPLSAQRTTGWPLYITGYGGYVRKNHEVLEITAADQTTKTVRLGEVSQVVLMGPVSISTPTVVELAKRDIPLTYLSSGGWFLAHTIGTGHNNVAVRTAQYQASFDATICLDVARALVRTKILNARTLLRRNSREVDDQVLRFLKALADTAAQAESLEALLGYEGTAAAQYFGAFNRMLVPSRRDEKELPFRFENRNRRPPKDPVNAMLSLAYALLVRQWTVALSAVGLDPYRGFYHQPRFGRPSLALDLMEPYRPLIADSVVITAVNNGEVNPDDFLQGAAGCALTRTGRKKFIAGFERRIDQEFTHPVFGYRISYRRALEVDARLFGRYLLGEFQTVPVWTSR
jgi:CRISPR-associated protein Cas1